MRLNHFIMLPCLCAFLFACGSPEERAAEYLARAQELQAAGDFESAKLEALSAVQIQPKNAAARFLLAELAEKTQDVRQAIGHLLVAIESDPTMVEANIKLGMYYFFIGAKTQATEQAKIAMELAPDVLQARLLNAYVALMNGDREGAVEAIDAALELEPDTVDAIMFKASIFQEPGNRERAFEIADEAIERLGPEKARPLVRYRAELLRAEGRLKEWETELHVLVPLFPEDDSIQRDLVSLYLARGDIDEAEDLMRELVAQDPDNARTSRQALVGFLAQQRSMEVAEEVLKAFIEESPDLLELQVSLGEYYERGGRPEEALAVYQEIAALGPTSEDGLDARNRIVAAKVQMGDTDGARRELASILTDAPDNTVALLYRAGFLYEDEAYDEALANLRIVLRRSGNEQRAWLLLARTYLAIDEPILAEDAYRQLLVLNPGHPKAASELGRVIRRRRGALDEVSAVLRAALEANPGSVDVAAELIDTHLAAGDIERAEEEVARMLEMNLATGQAEFQLARVLKAKGDDEGAIKAYKRSLEQTPTALLALRGLAVTLVENGRGDEARAFLETVARENPDREDIQFMLGTLYAQEGDQQKAGAAFEQVIAAKPEDPRAYQTLALLYPDNGAQQEEIYLLGLEANPKNERLVLLLGGLYEAQGRLEEALAVFERGLAANEDHQIFINNVAAILLDLREDTASHARALTLARQFRNARNPILLDTLGWAYYRNEQYLDAVRFLEMAAAGSGQDASMRYHLGMAYNATENPVGAKEELSKALDLAGTDPNAAFTGIDTARETLKRLNNATAASG